MFVARGRAESEECRARLRRLEEASERAVAPLNSAAAESGARADGLAEERRRLQEQLQEVRWCAIETRVSLCAVEVIRPGAGLVRVWCGLQRVRSCAGSGEV